MHILPSGMHILLYGMHLVIQTAPTEKNADPKLGLGIFSGWQCEISNIDIERYFSTVRLF